MTPAEALDQALAAARAALPRWVPRRAFDAFVAANRDALIARVAASPRFRRGPLALPAAPDPVRWQDLAVAVPTISMREQAAANAPATSLAPKTLKDAEDWLASVDRMIRSHHEGGVETDEDRAVLAELLDERRDAEAAVRRLSPATASPPSSGLFVVSTVRNGKEFWQINGRGRRMRVKTASQILSDMAPQPPADATTLERHRLTLPFVIRRPDGSQVDAVAIWGRGSAGGWSTLEEWRRSDESLAGSKHAQRPEGARWSGRADHEDRRERRVERLKAGAAKSAAEAEERRAAAGRGLPEFGQPILVGHHSERKHRRAIERSHENMRRSIDAADRSRNLASRADAAEKNRAISSDDPNAPERLREKIAELEAEVARSKAINKAVRAKDPHAALAAMGFSEKAIARLLTPDFAGRKGVPDFYFTNTGANIRRLKARLQQFEQAAETAAPAPVTIGSGTASWDTESNRVVVELPRPTSDEEKKRRHEIMRSSGFVWSPSRSAYVRQANNRAWWSAKSALEAIERVP